MTTASKTGERGSVASAVRKYFTDAPNTDIYVNTIVSDTGLSRKQVLNAIGSRKYAGDPMRCVVSGQIYRWDGDWVPDRDKTAPAPKAGTAQGDMFLVKQIGTLDSGELILQDEETKVLYRASKLK